MKQTIRKFINGLVMTAGFAIVVTSCQKQQDTPSKQDVNDSELVVNSRISEQITASACAGTIPDLLKVPEGNRLSSQAFARGVQVYQVQRNLNDPNVIEWVNIEPIATLYSTEDFVNVVANHFVGPTWEFTKGFGKGEKVVAKKEQEVTPDPSAIQWLLLKADTARSSENNKVTYVQRICTRGGLAPTTGADEAHLGQKVSIPYTASYLFYTATPANE